MFDAELHRYTLDGREVPHVTQIITRVFGAPWQAEEWYLERGRAVHEAARLLVQGRLDFSSLDPRITGRVRAIKQFLRDFEASVLFVEQRVFSQKYQFAGTADLGVATAGVIVLVDWKGTLLPQAELQLAGYAIALEDMMDTKIKHGTAVELHDNGGYKSRSYDLRRSKQIFLAALTVYGFMERMKIKKSAKPWESEYPNIGLWVHGAHEDSEMKGGE